MRAFLALVCFIAYLNAWAAIGQVSDTKGTQCSIERSRQKLPGDKGAGIESMDTYVTGGCIANITFKDDTKVKVSENSRLLIDDFVFDPKQSDAGKLALKVGMGTVRYASGQIAKNNPQRVDIKTPTATVAVRGTDFNMVVDEAGQSLVILVPSCKNEEDVKKYELQENRCKVGKIEVQTLAGIVTLDKAFEATYVASTSIPPSAPVIINTIEAKIDNNLILARPPEVQKAVKPQDKSQREIEEEQAINDQMNKLQQRIRDNQQYEIVKVTPYTFDTGKGGCNPIVNVCVKWERPDSEILEEKGRGIAFRGNDDHYAEVKTQGYSSNTTVIITQDDQTAMAIIGNGDFGGNIVRIKQSTGVVKLQ